MITFNTTQYQFSHGKRPAGKGMWMLKALFGDGSTETFVVNGTVTEAKAYVKRRIAEAQHKYALVEVLP